MLEEPLFAHLCPTPAGGAETHHALLGPLPYLVQRATASICPLPPICGPTTCVLRPNAHSTWWLRVEESALAGAPRRTAPARPPPGQ
jgi:hypothetical protein